MANEDTVLDLDQNMNFKESIIRQKSRCKWIKDGDQNSMFFHSFMKEKYRRNGTVVIRLGNYLSKDVNDIKDLALNHFKERL